MQAGKADKQPPPTQLVTLLMQTPQLYACTLSAPVYALLIIIMLPIKP
jgi:hypothetical protein